MPILKQLVAGSSQPKRRTRMELTADMISSPLGDFRHTMHVGRSGDAFGDTSFLGTRSGEPPREHPRSPRPSLLSRTFKGNKRSQSVTRVDCSLSPDGASPTAVKSAMSLPYLNNEHGTDVLDPVTQSLSASPVKQLLGRHANGDFTAEELDLEMHERRFGELTDLPMAAPISPVGGLKHAVSVLSFHVDLGPSMLGDVLDVMEREEDDLGFEEGHASPGFEVMEAMEDGVESGPALLSFSVEIENQSQEANAQVQHNMDSYSTSSSGSTVVEEKPSHQQPADDCPTQAADETFCFMEEEEEDEEIRL